MEKKVYVINVWSFQVNEKPETLITLPRKGYDEEYDAEDRFLQYANYYLGLGYKIVHITHTWCYWFVKPDGHRFDLYMFESTVDAIEL